MCANLRNTSIIGYFCSGLFTALSCIFLVSFVNGDHFQKDFSNQLWNPKRRIMWVSGIKNDVPSTVILPQFTHQLYNPSGTNIGSSDYDLGDRQNYTDDGQQVDDHIHLEEGESLNEVLNRIPSLNQSYNVLSHNLQTVSMPMYLTKKGQIYWHGHNNWTNRFNTDNTLYSVTSAEHAVSDALENDTTSEGNVRGKPKEDAHFISSSSFSSLGSSISQTMRTRYPNGTRVVKTTRVLRKRPIKGNLLVQASPHRNDQFVHRKNLVRQRLAKFLSLFTIIKFGNDPCQTRSGAKGTCLHHLECRSQGGQEDGSCASDFGVCCYFQRTCDEQTSVNCTYFVNPDYPGTNSHLRACLLTLIKKHPHVSQIRLDFFDFELAGPTNGTCVDDQFIVTGQQANSIVPVLCGFNTGQHVYLDVDMSPGPYTLTVINNGNGFPRRFRIKVTQLKKNSPLLAPKHCLQYFTEPKGYFGTFNYQSLENNSGVMPGYLNNLNYAICIKKADGYCGITYRNVASDGTVYPFQLININEDGESLVPPGQAGAEVFNCPNDYIVVNGVRLCGDRFNDASSEIDFTRNSPVTDTGNGPFIIPVRTNSEITARGFRLEYMQQPCQL